MDEGKQMKAAGEQPEDDFAAWEQAREDKAKAANRGPVERVEIELADNGFLVTTRYQAKPQKKVRGGCYNSLAPWPEPDKNVFTDGAEMAAHVVATFARKRRG